MITVLTQLRSKPGMEPSLQRALEEMARHVAEQEPGTVRFFVHRVQGSPSEFLLYEQYRDREAQREHGESAHMANLRRSLRRYAKGDRTSTNLELIAECVHAPAIPDVATLRTA
jgi:quinol monooxygenase YgiN